MNLPGFTAEATLYKTSGLYQDRSTYLYLSIKGDATLLYLARNGTLNFSVTEKFFTRLDVTEEFPFLVTKMSLYYDG